MPSGGPRGGAPGAVYQNRSDLSGDSTATPVGATQEAVQQATPNTAPVNVPPPGAFGKLTDPTRRPDEPITAGLPIGGGAGPASMPGQANPALWELRALARRFPDNPDLLRVIAMAEREL